MRTFLTGLAVTAAALGAMAVPASAASTNVYYETVADGDTQFIPACIPGPDNPTCDPRGAGSVLISNGSLAYTQGGATVGSVSTRCTTTRKVGNDYYGVCTDVLTTPQGKFTAVGEINESALERYEAQNLCLTGAYGTLTVQQVVYPNVFKLTVARH
ncbi:hypothetical protein [Actinomadura parmotrematis]|uniref:Secreted protein n=1 Tax=Actinomadura parmotrematis TaxID=2864039 RepID=A0ABS7FZZ8_9ACTN|nr:hypothetical protein [Actinomadura parmotrematis]MBW8485881.1 hypothetical protein [Actinomadura parmotrematis]